MGIEIDLERDSLLGEVSRKRLRESYMKEEEQSPQERFATVAETFASNPAHAQRIYDYASKHWLSFSTPILSFGRSKKGLPISCFEVYMQDTAEGLVNTLSEVNWLSMLGGGVGIHVDIRSADDKSVGVMPHLKIYDAACLAYRQGRTRRGSILSLSQGQHQKNASFLRVQRTGRNKTVLSVIDFRVFGCRTGRHTRGANDRNAVFSCPLDDREC